MKKLLFVVLLIPAVLFGFNTNEQSFQSNNGGFRSDEGTFNSNKSKYNPRRGDIKGTVAGVPWRTPEDLIGLKHGFVPLILQEGTQIKFSAGIQDFIGDNPPQFTSPQNNDRNSFGSLLVPATEMTVTMDDYQDGSANTDPGVKDAEIKISWTPLGNDRVKMKLWWKVQTNIINPRTKRFYDDYGKCDMILFFTDENGGTFRCEHDRPKSVDEKLHQGSEEASWDGYVYGGNFVIAMPNQNLRNWGNFTGGEYLDTFLDITTPTNNKPYPISEKYFENGDTITAIDNAGNIITITSFEQYNIVRSRVVKGEMRIISGSACRLDPVCLTHQDDSSALNFPVIDPQSDFYNIKIKIERNRDGF